MFSKKNKLNSFFDILKKRGLVILITSIVNLIHLNIAKKIFKKKLILKRVNEYKMYLLTNDNGISRSLILFGRREEDQKYILSKVLKENMNIFDIGANIGYYTILFLNKIKSGNILAIEPSKDNLKLCKDNVSLNNLVTRKVRFINGGVSNRNSRKRFFLSKQSNLHTFNSVGSAKRFLSGKSCIVETFTVQKLSKLYFVPHLIRMDVEGHECEIISGMLRYIKKGLLKPHICFEPHITSYSKNNNFSKILTQLFKLGYFTNLISSNAESGTQRIYKQTGRKPLKILNSDGEKRGIFSNISSKDTILILTKLGGARTVLLSPKNQ